MDVPVLSGKTVNIGVISDTHRHLSPLVFRAFHSVDHIIHAGDIGDWDIILALESLAPVTAVHGNSDSFGVRKHCKGIERMQVNDILVEVTHILNPATPKAPESIHQVKIFGHLHIPNIEHYGDTLYINPGSASRPRDNNYPTVVLLQFHDAGYPSAQIITLR